MNHLSYTRNNRKKKDSFTGLINLIPQSSNSLPSSPYTKNYWGFYPDVQNICKKGICTETETQTIHKSYSWEFIGGSGEESVHSWTKSASNWLDQIFSWKELMKKISEIKGTWKVKADW